MPNYSGALTLRLCELATGTPSILGSTPSIAPACFLPKPACVIGEERERDRFAPPAPLFCSPLPPVLLPPPPLAPLPGPPQEHVCFLHSLV